jgi:hypothetical protein
MKNGEQHGPKNDAAPANEPAKAGDQEAKGISRRKLVYAAPMLLSAGMLYQQSGCGKINPRTAACQKVPRNS